MRVNERSSDVYSADIIFGAYSVATLKGGYKTFEILDRNDLADIKSAAKTKKVWDRWGGEMSKKSAVRRHRKTLPLGDRDLVINDSEAAELYRSEERRVGKEWVSTCRYRCSPYH